MAAAATSSVFISSDAVLAAAASFIFPVTKGRIHPPRLPIANRVTTSPLLLCRTRKCHFTTVSCLPTPPSTRLFVSGLSFRTTEESLRNAFKDFGQLIQVNLVMDRIANRPRGFAFLRYATMDEAQKAIEGMHGKFLDGRVIFVEYAKSKSELSGTPKQIPKLAAQEDA